MAIKLFKPGRHVDSKGGIHEFSEADLRATAAAYNPDLHAAPMVIGHPKLDDPKYGTIGSLSFSAGFLLGEPVKVDPQFAEEVNSGKRDRVSVSWYSPDSPSNPVPGVFYPRHVGFLGAVPPGCKGLGAVSFADGEEGIIEFGDYEDRLAVRMFRGIKNLLLSKFSPAEVEQAINEWDLEQLTEDAVRPETIESDMSDQSDLSYADHNQGGAMTLTAQQLEQKEKDLTAREAVLNKQAADKTRADNLAFAEGLVADGKLRASQKELVAAALNFAEGVNESDTIEFGEGDAKQNLNPAGVLKEVLGAMPKIIEFAELAAGNLDVATGKKEEHVALTKYM